MSASVIHWNSYNSLKILRKHDTSGAALYVFWALSAHKNERGRAYPKIDTLVRETGFSRPTVIEAIKVLASLGIISKVSKDKRVDEELEIAYQRSMYQVHGTLTYKGESYPLLYMPSNESKEVGVNEINFNEIEVNDANHYNVVLKNQHSSKKEELKDSTEAAKSSAIGGEVEPSKSETPELEESPTHEETQINNSFVKENNDLIKDALLAEENIDKRIEVAQSVDFPPRPSETTQADGTKYVDGLTKTAWHQRLEMVIDVFTGMAGYQIRKTARWLVLETDYDIQDLLAMWRHIRNSKAGMSLPCSVKGKGRGIQWGFDEWDEHRAPVVKVKQSSADPDCEYCGGAGVVQTSAGDLLQGINPTYGNCICLISSQAVA